MRGRICRHWDIYSKNKNKNKNKDKNNNNNNIIIINNNNANNNSLNQEIRWPLEVIAWKRKCFCAYSELAGARWLREPKKLPPLVPPHLLFYVCFARFWDAEKIARSENDFFAQFLGFLTSETLIRNHFGSRNGSPGTTFQWFLRVNPYSRFWNSFFVVFLAKMQKPENEKVAFVL